MPNFFRVEKQSKNLQNLIRAAQVVPKTGIIANPSGVCRHFGRAAAALLPRFPHDYQNKRINVLKVGCYSALTIATQHRQLFI